MLCYYLNVLKESHYATKENNKAEKQCKVS